MKKVFIISPVGSGSGGTEAIHQLSDKLIRMGVDAYVYFIGDYEKSGFQNKFSDYKVHPINEIDDDSENLIITPETYIRELYKYKKAMKAIWWLSVDFYPGSQRNKINLGYTLIRYFRDFILRTKDKKWLHFVQSEYARDYVIKERFIPEKNVYYLSDFISSTFFKNINLCRITKENTVLFNPKKGYEYTKQIMDRFPCYKWVPLVNLTHNEMKDVMLKSKVYIDFGNHPGKDRIPREASLCGCCILTGKRGAAANDIDVAISSKYKFEDNENSIVTIGKTIETLFEKYEEVIKEFDDYRSKILNEEKGFEDEIRLILKEN